MGTYSNSKVILTIALPLFTAALTSCSLNKETEVPINMVVREEIPTNERQVLFVAQRGDIDGAIDLYRNWSKENHKHDFSLLQSIGESILREGAYSNDWESISLSAFGAGISQSDSGLQILQNLAMSRNPYIQMTALRSLNHYPNEDIDRILVHAMGSYILPIRIEALALLAKKRSPNTLPQIESLMAKLPPEYHSIFPGLLTAIGNDHSVIYIRQMLTSPQDHVRIAAIHASARAGISEVLPEIRQLATQRNVPQQEACAMALGVFQDRESIPILNQLAQSEYRNLRLPALRALYHMGDDQAGESILAMASQGDLYAIESISRISGHKSVLLGLLESGDQTVRMNALIGLLSEGDPACLHSDTKETIMDYLIKGPRDLGLKTVSTAGRSCHAMQIVPSASEQLMTGNELGSYAELAIRYREKLIQIGARTLPRETFIEIAKQILDAREDALVPVVMSELEKIGSDEAIGLLQENSERIGAPLIRHYSNLTLLKIGTDEEESKNCRKKLEEWIANSQKNELIQFRSLLAAEDDGIEDPFSINPNERSKLMIESLTTIASMQDELAIDTLLEAIRFGHPKNRYALAGLLIRTGQ